MLPPATPFIPLSKDAKHQSCSFDSPVEGTGGLPLAGVTQLGGT